MRLSSFLLGTVLLSATPALAQTAPVPPASHEPPICTDRPTRSNSVCTVPTGRWQLETDAINWTRSRSDGVRTELVLYTNPYLKYGVAKQTDVEASIATYVTVRSEAGGAHDAIGGAGDLYLRVKQRFTAPDAKLQVGAIPFVKVPTARRGIGNREWEGGVAVPVQYSLPAGTMLTFGPEIDLLHDGDGRGSHLQYVGTVNLGKTIAPNVTLYGELWTAQNDDPDGSVAQYSADIALAWLVQSRLQLDAGGNFGLNRATPDAQLYLGVSTRF